MLDNLIKEFANNIVKNLNNEVYGFLEKNGYDLEKNNKQQFLKLKEKLAKEDKQIRIETAIVGKKYSKYGIEPIRHKLIFFDSIKHPLGEKDVEKIISEDYWKNQYKQKDKIKKEEDTSIELVKEKMEFKIDD